MPSHNGKIEVHYRCKGCGLESSVKVTERDPNEDVVVWMKRTSSVVQVQHEFMSPDCTEYKVDLLIPIDDKDAPIGTSVQTKRTPDWKELDKK